MTDTWVRTAGLAGAALFLLGGTAVHTADAAPSPGKKGAKVTLCHRTNSEGNPYVRITVSTNAADAHGHRGHTGPVFQPGLKAQHVKWGDIIPPADDAGAAFPSMNWTADGQAIWRAGCRVPKPVTTTTVPTTTAVPAGPTQSPPTGGGGEEVGVPDPPSNPNVHDDARVESETLDRTASAATGTGHSTTAAAPADAIPGSASFAG